MAQVPRISMSLREHNYQGFEKVKVIGEGAFGRVYKCKENGSDDFFAMKKISIARGKSEEEVVREVLVLAALDHHERLIKFFGSKREKDKLQIFFEYMPKGSLYEYIKEKGPLSEKQTSIFAKQIIEGIEYLHNVKIIHRDIKPSNVLLDENSNLKLTDFGLSKTVENISAMDVMTCCGTVKYMAPEMLSSDNCNKAVDIWSLGVTVVEMINGETVFPDLGAPQFLYRIAQKDFQFEVKKSQSKQLKYFLRLTFNRESSLRPSATDMKRTQFIIKFENK